MQTQVDPDDDGSHFTTIPAFSVMKITEPTPEELSAISAQERADIIDRCAKAGTTKGLSEEERAKVANEPAFLRVCQSERAAAKEAMEARVKKEKKQ